MDKLLNTVDIMQRAKSVKKAIALADNETKNKALEYMAQALIDNKKSILDANAVDVENAKGKISDVMIDRLRVTEGRIDDMAKGIREVILLDDPCQRILSTVTRPNGLVINKISVPIGVVAIIYESRPNVTADAASLAIKSGNACILRGGKEAFNTSDAIADAMRAGLEKAGLPKDCVQLVQDITRNSSYELMNGVGYVDLLIPRGGAGLIRACVENAKVPCIETGTGICHIYVDKDADIEKALSIVNNAKTSRPSVCNAAEVCIVHKDIARDFLPKLYDLLVEQRRADNKIPVSLRLDERAIEIIEGEAAGNCDFDTEFLDYILAVKIVDSINDAIEHIDVHSTGHSEAIITESVISAELFTSSIDSSAVYVNASTRFTDGGEFGLGCEIGISTQKIHARGPMGISELTSYKYVIVGNGQIR